jgi:CRISPR-associated protein Cas1
MIKRTLYFGNPAKLSTQQKQLVIQLTPTKENEGEMIMKQVPIEDIGILILDHPQLTITNPVLNALLDNNVAIIACNEKHMPNGLFLPLEVHHTQQERFEAQVNASQPLKKQLWQQTVIAKIKNQAAVLRVAGKKANYLDQLVLSVKSGDSDNCEATAAAYYWKNLFDFEFPFLRDPDGEAPNNLLNYGYAIMRAAVARSLVGSGLLPTLGIFHRNKYNAYCLADDIMEPYRPYVDRLIWQFVQEGEVLEPMSKLHKVNILDLMNIDVSIAGKKSPLMIGVQRTTASLAQCIEGKAKKILYPEIDLKPHLN